MKEVEVSASVPAPADEIEAKLDPESIINYAEAYEITETEVEQNGRILHLTNEKFDLELRFTELENGYAYSQRGEAGPFDEMRTRITIEEVDCGETEISARSTFTFGGYLWFVIDRLGVKYRREELERTVGNLAMDVAEGDRVIVRDGELAVVDDANEGNGGDGSDGDGSGDDTESNRSDAEVGGR